MLKQLRLAGLLLLGSIGLNAATAARPHLLLKLNPPLRHSGEAGSNNRQISLPKKSKDDRRIPGTAADALERFSSPGRPLSPQAARLSAAVRRYVSIAAHAVALENARLIDGTGTAARTGQTIVIENGKIAALGNDGAVRIPPGATVVRLTGDTLLPGLVLLHEHLFYPNGGRPPLYGEMAYSFPRLYLACGVTTARTTGSIEPYTDLSLKKLIDTGRIPGPDFDITGPYLEGRGAYTPDMHELSGPQDATRTVKYWAEEGATSFKAYMHITRAELAAAIRAAHAQGDKITGHLCAVGFREAARLGIDDLEHGLMVDTEFDPGKRPDVCPSQALTEKTLASIHIRGQRIRHTIAVLIRHHVAVTSTLPVFETFAPNRPSMRFEARVLPSLLPEERIAYLTARARIAARAGHSLWPALLKKEMEFEREFALSGGLLLAGEDPTGYGGDLAGFGDQRELELLVEAGFTPVQAVHIATYNGALYLSRLRSIGTIAVGKRADLLVVRGNLAANIRAIEHPVIVFKDGVGYDPLRLIRAVRGQVGLH